MLVLDVNPDYQPWLVARKRLFAAVDTVDGDKKRGLLLIESSNSVILPAALGNAHHRHGETGVPFICY